MMNGISPPFRFLLLYRFSMSFKQQADNYDEEFGDTMLSISVPPPPPLACQSQSGDPCPCCRSSGRISYPPPPSPFNLHPTAPPPPDTDAVMMRYILDRQKCTEAGQAVVIEWRQLAALVDRILFWVFCVVTCVSSFLFLLIIPGWNRGWFSPKQQ